jgi:hypothetical protein
MLPTNFLGLGAADLVEVALAALLLALVLAWRPRLSMWLSLVASRTGWCILLLAATPVVLRMVLLPGHPVPRPQSSEEFSHLLAADTLGHFRLANPAHPLHRFFETFLVVQHPAYNSIDPAGQGIAPAIGWTLFGTPWAGVILATAALCALCYWMLRGWASPGWALAGGLLAVTEFGPLSPWMNSYAGGAVSAGAGCLVFGALPRLSRDPQRRGAMLLGLGLALHLVTRPFESIFLFLSVALWFVPMLRKPSALRAVARVLPEVLFVLLPAVALMAAQNKAVTGNWITTPQMLSRYQYGVPPAFTFQPNATPHNSLTPQQALEYQVQAGLHGAGTDTVSGFLQRLAYRVRYYRFFFPAPLYLALAAFLLCLRQWRYAWAALTLALFALGTNFFPAFQPHYIAAATGLFLLAQVAGLERIHRVLPQAALLLVFLVAAQFVFWFSLHAFFDSAGFSRAVQPYETWDAITHRLPTRRLAVETALDKIPGKLLVLVRYSPRHMLQDEWVYNRADIDAARIVWARDLGTEENGEIRGYYPDRSVWLLQPDVRPPLLEPYQNQDGGNRGQ